MFARVRNMDLIRRRREKEVRESRRSEKSRREVV